MPLSERENYLRNATMTGPQWIPCTVHISGASWNQLREDLEDVLVRHPTLFPGFEKGKRDYDNWDPGPANRAGEYFEDAWGCVWRSEIDGIEGIVQRHPLEDWSKLTSWRPPDPLKTGDRGPVDWESIARNVQDAKKRGELTRGGVAHGFLFMRLTYLRGFDNLMTDLVDEPPQLSQLIEMVQQHNRALVNKWLELGVDVMEFGEDLGTQTASIISPAMFRKWFTPQYKALMQPCRDAGTLVALHSDGYIMELMDEFIEAGVDIVNPQDLCNGIDDLAREVKGRMCIRLDVDRQKIVPFGTRKDIHDLIEEEVRKLGSPRGGLEMLIGIYPPTPPENVDAVCEAFEKFRTYWWDGRAFA